jgi:hypothetical protein
MYLEGTQVFDNTDIPISESPLILPADGHVFLVGSRIRKGGMIQGCPIWTLSDSKAWNNKNSVAKITRMNSVYCMKLTMTMPTPTVTSPTANPIPASAVEQEEAEEPAPATASTSAPGNSGVGQIAVTLRSKGVDKLIQLNAALTKTYVEEADLLQKLHAMTDVTRQQQLFADANYLLLRNRLPVTTSVNGKDIHAVDFGPLSRIRMPSRKNIVLEEIGMESNQWEVSDGMPLFQVGPELLILSIRGLIS